MAGAFSFGLVSIALVFLLSRTGRRSPILMLVLAGVIVSSCFTALTSFVTCVADPYDKLPSILVWLMGSVVSASFEKLLVAAIAIFVGSIVLSALSFRINVVSLGDEEAPRPSVSTSSGPGGSCSQRFWEEPTRSGWTTSPARPSWPTGTERTGKTTLLKCLVGILKLTEGERSW